MQKIYEFVGLPTLRTFRKPPHLIQSSQEGWAPVFQHWEDKLVTRISEWKALAPLEHQSVETPSCESKATIFLSRNNLIFEQIMQ